MQVIVNIPDEFVRDLVPEGVDAGRSALEAWAANEYRERRLPVEKLRRLLDFGYWLEVEAFLLKHEIYDYALEDFREDMEVQARLLG